MEALDAASESRTPGFGSASSDAPDEGICLREAATGGHSGRPVAAACAVEGAFEERSRGKFTVDFFFSKKGARQSGGHALPRSPPRLPFLAGRQRGAGRRRQERADGTHQCGGPFGSS